MNEMTVGRRRRSAGALAACAALMLASCGDDDSATDPPEVAEPPPTTAAGDTTAAPTTTDAGEQSTESTTAVSTTGVAATESADAGEFDPPVCTPFFGVSAAFAGEPDPAELSALLDDVDANAPDEIADDIAVLTTGARTVLETGDFGVFQRPEFNASIATADAWMAENCAFATTSRIVALDYRYEGQLDEYPAGRTSFTLVNQGAEAHEILLLRKTDGVELTLEEMMELPESEAETMTTYIGGVFVGPPGETGNLIVDLTAGDYIAVCTITTGTFVDADGTVTEGTGDPHVMLGMSFEFTVV